MPKKSGDKKSNGDNKNPNGSYIDWREEVRYWFSEIKGWLDWIKNVLHRYKLASYWEGEKKRREEEEEKLDKMGLDKIT